MMYCTALQGKGREKFFYTTELLADVAVHLLTLLHHMHVWLLHGMSFHLLDAVLLLDTRMVVMSFVHRVKAHMLHRCGQTLQCHVLKVFSCA
jgi:autocrine motility factor receptor